MSQIRNRIGKSAIIRSLLSAAALSAAAAAQCRAEASPMTERETLIQAHAGMSSAAPENTLAAFRAAKEAGADGLETDIRMTKDGELVIRHDDAIDTTSNGRGNISEMTLEELKSYDFGSWFSEKYAGEKILTLEECLAAAKAFDFDMINLELKPVTENAGFFVQKTADVIEAAGMSGRVMVSSFDSGLLKELKAYAPDIPAAMLTIPNLSVISMFHLADYLPEGKPLREYTIEDVLDVPFPVALLMMGFGAKGNSAPEIILDVLNGIAAVAPVNADWAEVEELIGEQADLVSYIDSLDFPVDYLNCHYNTLSDELIEAMHARGIDVNVWTPDQQQDLERVLSLHPDGVITNEPELAAQLRDAPPEDDPS